MNELLDQFKGLLISKTAKDASVVFVGNVISFLFGIVFAILAARAIEPSEWGVFSAAGGLMVILFAVSEMGLSAGLFKFVSGLWQRGEIKKVSEVASVILMTRIATALFFFLIMVIFAGTLSSLVLKTDNLQLIYFTALGLIGSLLTDFQISLLQAKRKWLAASFLTSLTNFFRLTFLFLVKVYWSFDLVFLFAVFFLSPTATFFVSLFFERPKIFLTRNSLLIFKKVSGFSLWMGVNRLVGSISSRVDAVLLPQLAGSFAAGIVGAARQLSNAVMILLASFATVIAPRFASYEGGHLKKYYQKVVWLSVLLGIGILGGVVFAGPLISLLGPKYAASAGVLKWLLVGLIPFALSSPPVNALIYAFHQPKIIALLSFIQLPLIIAGNFFLIPRLGVFGPVVVIALWNLSTLIVTGFFSYRYLVKVK